MEAICVKSGKFEVEVLDGKILSLISLNSPNSGNIAEREPLSMTKIAFVVGMNEPALTIEFNSPGDTSATKSELSSFIQAKIDEMQRRIER